MKRLLSSVRWNVQLQVRSGYYTITVLFILVMVLLLRQIPATLHLEWILPGFLLVNQLISYMFIVALLLLERAEGVLSGLAITPLRPREYIGAKVGSLLLLTLTENLLILLFSYGYQVRWLFLLLGLLLLSTFFLLFGFALGTYFRSINGFLLPGGAIAGLLVLPLLNHFELVQSWLFYLHPVQPMLTLLRSGFLPTDTAQIIYGITGSLVWTGCCAYWAYRASLRALVQAQDA